VTKEEFGLTHNVDIGKCGVDTQLFLLGVLPTVPLGGFRFSPFRLQMPSDHTISTLQNASSRNGLHDQILYGSFLCVPVVHLVFVFDLELLLQFQASCFLAF